MDKKELLKRHESPENEPGPSDPRMAVLPRPAASSLPRRFTTRWIRNIGRNLLPSPTDTDPESFPLRVVDFPSTRTNVWHYSQEKTPAILKEPEVSTFDTSNKPLDPCCVPGPTTEPLKTELFVPGPQGPPFPCCRFGSKAEPLKPESVSLDPTTIPTTEPFKASECPPDPINKPLMLEPSPTNDLVKPEPLSLTNEPSNREPATPSPTATPLTDTSKLPVMCECKTNHSKEPPVSCECTKETLKEPLNLCECFAPAEPISPAPLTEPSQLDTSTADAIPPNLAPVTSVTTTDASKPESTSTKPIAKSTTSESPESSASTKPGSTESLPATDPSGPSSQKPTSEPPKPVPTHEFVDESESKRKRLKFSKDMFDMSNIARACNRLRVWDEVRYGTKIPKDEVDDDYVAEMMLKGKLQHGLKYSKEGDDKVVWPEANYKSVQADKFTVPKVIEPKKKKKKKVKDDVEMLALLAEQKEKEKEMEEMMRKIDRRKAFTGLFNDGYRRIDLVIVITKSEHSPVEQAIKMEFVSNLVKHGLEIEVEEGFLPEHAHLLFIKVHAPSKFLQEYAEFFGAKKQFKEKHLEFVKVDAHSLIDRTFKQHHEKEWLKLIRLNYIQPLNYSNRERSYITYMVLRCVPFGDHSNYFSINRLIDKKVICDVYALHDGPYYYTEDQDYNLVSARQILYYHWTGWHNILMFQPLTLVHEYFGSKVAFYFAFFEFFTISLILLSIFGVITFILGVVLKNPVYEHYKGKVCDSGLFTCPYCMDMKACVFKNITDDCFKLKLLGALDTDYLILFAIGACVWAAIFIIFWNRFQKFYIWLWELKLRPRWPTIRTEYYVNTEIRRSRNTGIIKRYSTYFESFQRVVVVRLIMLLLFAIIVAFVYGSLEIYYFLYGMFSPNLTAKVGTKAQYVALLMLVLVTLLITNLLQRLFYYICIIATKYENHRTIENYEKSLILKVFGSTAACTFVFLIYFSYFKGTFYTLPHARWEPRINFTFNNKTKSNNAKFLGKLFQTNCGLFGCLDEAMIMYASLILGNIILQRLWTCLLRYKTDYSSLDPSSDPPVMPVWEREYQLLPVTDLEMLGMFTSLIMQFALVTWFVVLFPLGPFILLLMNIWFLRRTAQVLLVNSRRPVLYNVVGIGAWNSVLKFIAYTSAFTTAVIIAKLTTAITRYTFMTQATKTDTWEGLFDNFTISFFNTTFYKEERAQNDTYSQVQKPPDYCVFPGMYITSDMPGVVWDYKKMKWPWHVPYMETNPGNYRPKANKYFKNLFELYFITFFLVMILVLVLVMKYYIPTITPQIKKVIIIEEALKKVYEKNVVGKKKKKVAQIQPKATTQQKII